MFDICLADAGVIGCYSQVLLGHSGTLGDVTSEWRRVSRVITHVMTLSKTTSFCFEIRRPFLRVERERDG